MSITIVSQLMLVYYLRRGDQVHPPQIVHNKFLFSFDPDQPAGVERMALDMMIEVELIIMDHG